MKPVSDKVGEQFWCQTYEQTYTHVSYQVVKQVWEQVRDLDFIKVEIMNQTLDEYVRQIEERSIF